MIFRNIKFFTALLFFILVLNAEQSKAQCTLLANAIQGISYTYVQAGGTNASGVAYNPGLNIYYACIAGNPGFPFETFDATGTSLYQTNTGFDFRGLWWNPNTGQLEGNGFNSFGWWTSDLDGNGWALNTGLNIFPGLLQPDMQSCGDYDCDADEIIYYFSGNIHRYSRSAGTFIASYPLTGMPVPVGNINWTSVVYTGCPGHEIGIEDYVNKSILVFDKSNGAYTGTCMLPATQATNNGFRFSWANNLAWLYDVSNRTWTSFSIFSGSIGGSANVNLGNDTTVCNGQTVTLDAGNPGASYLWQDGSTTQTYNVTQSGTYIVGVSNGGCYITHDTIIVNVIGSASSLNLGNDTTLCSGASVVLDATTTGATYLWQDGSTNASLNANTSGQFWVVLNFNGCTASDTINITIAQPGALNIGNDTSICENQTLVLDATTPGATYLWQNNTTNATYIVNAAGTYSVTVTVGNCTPLSDAITVSYYTAPAINLGNDTSICNGQSVILDATLSGASYLWQNGSVNSTFNLLAAGNYSVTVTDANGCTASDNINISVNNAPVVNLGNDTTLCGTQTLVLDANTAGGIYLWNDGSANSSISVNAPGNYFVDVTVNNCMTSDTINVSYISPPAVSIGNDTTLCPGEMIDLDAGNAGSSFLWQDNSTGQGFNVNSGGVFWVQVTAGSCPPVTDSINVTYISGSTVFLGNDTMLCPGETIFLDATQPGATYLWQDGSQNASYLVSSSGNYHVTVNISICTESDTIQVGYINPPYVNMGNDTAICPDEEMTLNAYFPNSTYVWSDNLNQGSTYTTSDSGMVWVQVTNECSSVTDSIHITDKICNCTIFVPTAFTPNGDELNETFQPKFICDFIDYQFLVFSRWGELIFSSDDPLVGWDGTFGGIKLNTGVFAWVLKYKYSDGENGTLSQMNGDVTLIR